MIEGGPGWHIDGETLLPVVTGEAEFREAYADDPAVDVLVALWGGEPGRALAALAPLLAAERTHWRWRALEADAKRDSGDHAGAITAYEQLVAEQSGSGREATLVQHLGKAHFVAGDYRAAAECFQRAVDLRIASGADPVLIGSSRAALERSGGA